MPKKKKPKPSPTDFSAVQVYFRPRVAALYAVDDAESATAFSKFAQDIFKYGRRLAKSEATPGLIIYLYGRDRATKASDKNVYELSLELAMPGKFPPLPSSMRKTLALRLAYADKLGVVPRDLPDFLGKKVPLKIMKDVLAGLREPPLVSDVLSGTRAALSTRPAKRKRIPHRLASSASHQIFKAGARARRKATSVSE